MVADIAQEERSTVGEVEILKGMKQETSDESFVLSSWILLSFSKVYGEDEWKENHNDI